MRTGLRRAAFFLAGALGIVAATYGVLVLVASTRPPRPVHDFFTAPVRNVAHRGGGMLAPEATLAAFAAAARAGADILEMDVRLSADGALVVIHDGTVDRTTDGSGAVAELRLEELRSLNAGYRFRAPDGDSPYRAERVVVPTFEEVQAAHPDLPFVVEMKTLDTAEPLCRAIRDAGREDRTLVAAFGRESLERFRGACPAVATGGSFGEVVAFLALSLGRLSGLYDPPFDALLVSEMSGPLRVVTPRLLRSARQAGLPVFVWTVNRADDMRRLLALGVDGILTDDPVALSAAIAASR
ncbi:MAG: glycerophosphodiester phosphodiesterase [Acidobacteriota bacterium]|nr:glycerophosphodiester phosphodiesterase [Acidobacteriota bacterium]